MFNSDISNFLAKISSVLDERNLYDFGIQIDWESLAELYDLYDEIGEYNGNFFNIYVSDVIVRNIFEKDTKIFKNLISYISNRYNLPILDEYLEEYKDLFHSEDLINDFPNKMDKDDLKIFISFSNIDSEEALKIQEYFKNCGVDCFLSKTDIVNSDEYKNKIFKTILESDVFIYLLSEHSKGSNWCDQEMGIAFIKYKFGKSKIFIVSTDDELLPYGFLSSFNAGFTYEPGYLHTIARKIDEYFDTTLIYNIKEHFKNLVDLKIKELYLAESYFEAKSLLDFILNHEESLSKDQLSMICGAAISNNQIYNCIICQDPLIKILSKHKEIIDDNLYQKVFNKIRF